MKLNWELYYVLRALKAQPLSTKIFSLNNPWNKHLLHTSKKTLNARTLAHVDEEAGLRQFCAESQTENEITYDEV